MAPETVQRTLRASGEPPEDPPNGKKWWRETWGKAIGTVLAAALIWLATVIGAKALQFHAATVEVYSLPPRVKSLEAEMAAQRAKPPMTDAQVEKLARDIAAALKAKK